MSEDDRRQLPLFSQTVVAGCNHRPEVEPVDLEPAAKHRTIRVPAGADVAAVLDDARGAP